MIKSSPSPAPTLITFPSQLFYGQTSSPGHLREQVFSSFIRCLIGKSRIYIYIYILYALCILSVPACVPCNGWGLCLVMWKKTSEMITFSVRTVFHLCVLSTGDCSRNYEFPCATNMKYQPKSESQGSISVFWVVSFF